MICPICNCNHFYAHQVIRASVIVDENNDFVDNMPDGIEAHIYDSETPYGPYTCVRCGTEYDTESMSGGGNWIMTDYPYDNTDTEPCFRANDASTHETVMLHMKKIDDDMWSYEATTSAYRTHDSNAMIRTGVIRSDDTPVRTAKRIFDSMSDYLNKDTYTFEQAHDNKTE